MTGHPKRRTANDIKRIRQELGIIILYYFIVYIENVKQELGMIILFLLFFSSYQHF